MPSFGRMVADQWRADLQRVARDGPRWSAEHRVLRCRNVADVRAMARSALPRAVFDFVDGGANDELALARNIAAFRDLEIAAKVLVDVSELDLSTTVLGQPVALPILGAPTGLTGLVDPSGERAVAAALHAHGSAYVLSAMASYSIEDMAAAATGPLWFQLYMWRDRGFVDELLARIGAAGYGALVLTVDGPRAGRRERDITNGFAIPPRVTLRSLAEGVRHPRWSARFVREMRISIANTPAAAAAGGDALGIVEYVSRQFDPSVTWDDLARLRDRWTGPLVVKGIMRSDDAQQAVRLGADAVIVSNHGGRQLDDAPGTAQALARIV
ncbi:MAG: hypothetical protein QOF76_2058, partial [Solirubrobacteraceae bacterium]|nr:hypothetical protein [Solirubrobacteraceae bacterium]